MVTTRFKRPVTVFLVLTFVISYLVGIPSNIAVSRFVGSSGAWSTYLARLVTVMGPAVAALIVSGPQLLRSLKVARRHLYWLPVIALIGVSAAMLAFHLAGVAVALGWLLAVHFILQTATVGIGEELGWRGFLLPTLASRRTFASATALTGLAWILWHAPVFISSLNVALSFLALLAALTVILSWLWKRTDGSVGVAAMAHASVNAPAVFFEASFPEAAANAFAYLAAVYVCIAIVVLIAGRLHSKDDV